MVFVGGKPLRPSHTALPRFSKATPERPGLESPAVAGVVVLKTDFVRQGEEKAPDGVSGGCDSCRASRGVHEWLVSPRSPPPPSYCQPGSSLHTHVCSDGSLWNDLIQDHKVQNIRNKKCLFTNAPRVLGFARWRKLTVCSSRAERDFLPRALSRRLSCWDVTVFVHVRVPAAPGQADLAPSLPGTERRGAVQAEEWPGVSEPAACKCK